MKMLLYFLLLLLYSTTVLADVGIPVLVVQFLNPLLLLTFIPVVLIEYLYLAKSFHQFSGVFCSVLWANVRSTWVGVLFMIISTIFIGIFILLPLSCLSLYFAYRYIKYKGYKNLIVCLLCAFGQIFLFINNMKFPFQRETMHQVENWTFAFEGDKSITLFFKVLFWQIIACFVSWWVEYKFLKKELTQFDSEKLKKSVLVANILSYLFLLISLTLANINLS